MSGTLLKKQKVDIVQVNIELCIMCQTLIEGEKTRANEDGHDKIKEAAKIRKDNTILDRLKAIEGKDFVYHTTNKCYKTYTDKRALARIRQGSTYDWSKEEEECIEDEDYKKATRSSLSPRDPPSQHKSKYTTKCVICNQFKKWGTYDKYRISEDGKADTFLDATIYFQDEVFVRTSDLQDKAAVFGSDLYCHHKCSNHYYHDYERKMKLQSLNHKHTVKANAFKMLMKEITPELQKGIGFKLSSLRDTLNSNMKEVEYSFKNREVKLFLMQHFKSKIAFSQSTSANKSDMVFMANITQSEMVDVLRSHSPLEESANIIRQELLNVDFDLDDKFCDAQELEKAWNDMIIPESLLLFMSVLFNFNPEHFSTVNPETDEEDEEEETIEDDTGAQEEHIKSNISVVKKRKMLALFQEMYYVLHRGRKRTPMHVMNAESVHTVCKSKQIIDTTIMLFP